MKLTTLAGQRVAIVGMARSGIGAARLVKRLGGRALISDIKPAEALHTAIAELMEGGVDVETGEHRRIAEEQFDLVVLSPGVVPPAELKEKWLRDTTPVLSELEFAARACAWPWIGVTGSNGKTTTVNLIHAILKAAGYSTELVGNVGRAWSSFLPAPDKQAFVVEVSSFQLEYAPTVHPHVTVLLNLYENHLDRHGTMDVYSALKSRLFRNQTAGDWAIVNGDDARVMALAEDFKARIVRFGTSPQYEFWTDGTSLYYRRDVLLRRAELPLIGRHNELNALAAAAAAVAYGTPLTAIQAALRGAKAVEHRIEFVSVKHGVRYVNDSKSTNLIATQTALNSFTGNVILLFGGRPKKESFVPLTERFAQPVKHMIVFGEAVPKVKNEFPAKHPVAYTDTLSNAVLEASGMAEPGDTVLLSPGCTSFDQFNDYEERGRVFKACVEALP